MTHLSRHVCNDDPRYWRFERTSGLPCGYFDPPHRLSADAWVFVACLAGLALLLIVTRAL